MIKVATAKRRFCWKDAAKTFSKCREVAYRSNKCQSKNQKEHTFLCVGRAVEESDSKNSEVTNKGELVGCDLGAGSCGAERD